MELRTENMIHTYLYCIMNLTKESMASTTKENLKDEFYRNISIIKDILNGVKSEKSVDIYLKKMKELKSELRHDLIELCQKKAYELRSLGLENLIYYSADHDFKPIVLMDYLINLCDAEIEQYKKDDKEAEIIEEGNILYIYTDGVIRDLESHSIPYEFYEDFKELTELMNDERYNGKENRRKIMHNKELENTVEHRGNNQTRIYDNKTKTDNQKKMKRIKQLEKKIGLSIRFVYKMEIKKCKSKNGLDEQRIQRYKNEKITMEEFLFKATPEEVKEFAKQQRERIEKEFEEHIKDVTDEERIKVIGLNTINEYLHEDFNIKLFEEGTDETISEHELSKEKAEEREKYRVYRRLLVFLESKELKELHNLKTLFKNIPITTNNDIMSSKQKENQETMEKNRIISYIICFLRNMNMEELKKSERLITLLLDYPEDFTSYKDDDEKEMPYEEVYISKSETKKKI